MTTRSGFPDMLKLHFIVLLWGFAAILGRLISIPSVEIVLYRTLLAAAGLWLVCRWRGVSLNMPRTDLFRIMGIGALMAAHWIFFFASARVSTVSVCLAGMATTSLWTSMIEPIFHKRKIRLLEVILGLVIILGLYIIFRVEWGYWMGLLFAIISAFLAALFSVFNSLISHKYDHYAITYYEMSSAFIIVLVFLPVYALFISADGIDLYPTEMDWLWLVLLAGACTVYGWAQYIELMKRLTPFSVNLVLNMEPIYGILLAVVIFGESERMDPGFYLGAGVILISVFIYPYLNKNRRSTIPEMS